jgi:hypothetical protein
MANTITLFRIAAGIVLLFCPVFSPAFYALYIAAGLSDMLDGFVARKTDTVSKLGTLEAETDAGNAASQRVLEKCGFRPNGILGEERPRFTLDRPIDAAEGTR